MTVRGDCGHSTALQRSSFSGVAVGWAGWAKSRGPRVQGPRVPRKKIKNNFPVTVGETLNIFADFGL